MACLRNFSWMHGHTCMRARAKWRGWSITWICDSYDGMRDQMLNNIWPQDEFRMGNAKTRTSLDKKFCALQKFGIAKPSFAQYWTVAYGCKFYSGSIRFCIISRFCSPFFYISDVSDFLSFLSILRVPKHFYQLNFHDFQWLAFSLFVTETSRWKRETFMFTTEISMNLRFYKCQ